MGYLGSYIWRLRQAVGDMTLQTVTVDILPIRNNGEILLIYEDNIGCWANIGGHVEIGESFRLAAANELKGEAGLIVDLEDLKIFATISGPARIYQYSDGSTNPFTVAFFCEKWQENDDLIDYSEVRAKKWFTIDEIKSLKTISDTKKIVDAYETFLRTREVQMIEVYSDGTVNAKINKS